ncbi:hypothetical protein K439DRAFT_1646067 [Ramaria rubella]|nr:hypothetical protein K439DRAFT_1646067 [Ramaria rubella]
MTGEPGLAHPTPPHPATKHKPRISQALGNHISPSICRPHVLATKCITEWKSPFTIQHRHLLDQHFPSSHIHHLQDVMCTSVVKKTRGNWGYCDSINVPEIGCMPAPKILLCLFFANCGAGAVSEDCINSWLAGLHRWHQIHDAPWFGAKAMSLTIQGASRLVPEESRRPPRPPITIEHINCLHMHLDLSNTFDAAVFAIATIAFYGCNDLHLIDTHLPSSPILALEHHLIVNQNIPLNAPLFAWRALTGNWEPMTKEWFIPLQTMDGHSFCIGGMTWLLLLGVIRHWSSVAFLLYWCKIERILPDFISDAYHSTHSISACMSRFVSNL